MKLRRSEAAGEIGAGVDADPKAEVLGIALRGVAVDNDAPSKDIAGGQELVAYPQPVLFGLEMQGHPGPHARMQEMLVSAVIAL
jgi:hypothetical protein